MNPFRIFFLIVALLVCPSTLKAQFEEKDVEVLVRRYFATFQNQEWEQLVGMMHPKSLEELRKKILTSMPKNSSEIDEKNRDGVKGLLDTLSVGTPEEAWALRPDVVYVRLLEQSGKVPAAKALKDVVTEIKKVDVEKASEEFLADAEVESRINGKVFSGTTYFIIEPYEGTLKVVAMTKMKQPPKDEQGGTGQPATRPESKSEGSDKPQPESEGRSR
jgi:phage host-nuclease inhibitor protein Gam